ncbi:hypothetical protein [Rhizobacter sp. SG703]|uniref:hypothetical protein n=1 Tax=Rhizobacter sp. SG703 TaxID=2587140 RepID=UPI0014459633|nr:hypothetical protein [Rhizobacter sp. SG703]NKI94439.1 hypothetical protein [Rhizobacter sp. SG703]
MNRRIFAAALLMVVMPPWAAPALGHGSCLAGLCIEDKSAAVVERLGPPYRIDDLKELERRNHAVTGRRKRSDFGEMAYVHADPATLRFLFVFLEKGIVKTLRFAETE